MTTALNALQKLYFIVDGCGNFYRLNGKKELVAAADKRDAGTFSYLEVQERIGTSRQSKFYKAIEADSADSFTETSMSTVIENEKIQKISDVKAETGRTGNSAEYHVEKSADGFSEKQHSDGYKNPLYQGVEDLARVDWIELLQNVVYINAMLPAYKDQLQDDHSKIEQLICDILHYVELYEYDEQDALDLMERLREAREKRRIIKNELYRVDCFRNSVGSNGTAIRAREALEQIKSKEGGTYRPRVAPELFADTRLRPRNLNSCYADRDSIVQGDHEETEDVLYEEETMDTDIRYERIGTIYDGRKTDWLAFVREQADFFRNAEQHICDLQCDLESINEAIEEALRNMEDANYNVTQGYRAFKELKDLRNERKEVLAELEAVQIIAERFDCVSMREAYEEIEAEMTIQTENNTDVIKPIPDEPRVQEDEVQVAS